MPAVFEREPDIPKGLYEQLISREIARVLNDLRARGFVSEEEELDTADSHEVLARRRNSSEHEPGRRTSRM